jgi:hypothetical protein
MGERPGQVNWKAWLGVLKALGKGIVVVCPLFPRPHLQGWTLCLPFPFSSSRGTPRGK